MEANINIKSIETFDFKYDDLYCEYKTKRWQITNQVKLKFSKFHDAMFGEIQLVFRRKRFYWDEVVGVAFLRASFFKQGMADTEYFTPIFSGKYYNNSSCYDFSGREVIGKLFISFNITEIEEQSDSDDHQDNSFAEKLFKYVFEPKKAGLISNASKLIKEITKGTNSCRFNIVFGGLLVEKYLSNIADSSSDDLDLDKKITDFVLNTINTSAYSNTLKEFRSRDNAGKNATILSKQDYEKFLANMEDYMGDESELHKAGIEKQGQVEPSSFLRDETGKPAYGIPGLAQDTADQQGVVQVGRLEEESSDKSTDKKVVENGTFEGLSEGPKQQTLLPCPLDQQASLLKEGNVENPREIGPNNDPRVLNHGNHPTRMEEHQRNQKEESDDINYSYFRVSRESANPWTISETGGGENINLQYLFRKDGEADDGCNEDSFYTTEGDVPIKISQNDTLNFFDKKHGENKNKKKGLPKDQQNNFIEPNLNTKFKLQKCYFEKVLSSKGYSIPSQSSLIKIFDLFHFAVASYANTWAVYNIQKRIVDDKAIPIFRRHFLKILDIEDANLLSINLGSLESVQHIIFYDVAEDQIVVSFKGTTNPDETLQDINCEYSSFGEGYVHRGFLEYSRKFIEERLGIVEDYLKLKNCSQILFTGHSLGAAIAIMTHLIIKREGLLGGITLKTVAFAAPPIVSKNIAEQEHVNINVINYGNDIVSRLSYGAACDLKFMCASIGKKHGAFQAASTLNQDIDEVVSYLLTSDLHPKLYIPGNLLHLKRFKTQKNNPKPIIIQKKVHYTFFEQIILIKHAPLHHTIPHVYNALKDAIDFNKICEKLA